MIVNIFVGVLNMLPCCPWTAATCGRHYERLRSRRAGHELPRQPQLPTPFIYMFMSVLLVLFASTLYLTSCTHREPLQ